jgi:hypothetical protein
LTEKLQDFNLYVTGYLNFFQVIKLKMKGGIFGGNELKSLNEINPTWLQVQGGK